MKMKYFLPKDTVDAVHQKAFEEINEVKKHSALIQALGNPAMKDKHWAKVFALAAENSGGAIQSNFNSFSL